MVVPTPPPAAGSLGPAPAAPPAPAPAVSAPPAPRPVPAAAPAASPRPMPAAWPLSGLGAAPSRVVPPPPGLGAAPSRMVPPPPPPRRPRRPAKGSLHDVLRRHASTSLFVRPVCWTDLHAQLLGARFRELPPCDTPLPRNVAGSPPSRGHLWPSHTITTLSDALSDILLPNAVNPILSSNAIRTILSTLWPAPFAESQFLPDLHLFFGDRVYRDAVRTQIMWNYPGDGSAPRPLPRTARPMMCYVSKSQLAAMRRNMFRIAPGPGPGWNAPVFRLQRARSRLLVPANADHDVQFLAMFLAMAQRHFYATPPPCSRRDSKWWRFEGPPRRPDFRDVKLRILTHDNETAEFIVYTARVTANFLDRFHEPGETAYDDDGGVAGIDMEYTRVPIWPILGLRERLGKALGEEIVGPFDPTEMETWEADDAGRGKRTREALTDVCHASLDESDDDEARHVGVKKRCLGGRSPVGVAV